MQNFRNLKMHTTTIIIILKFNDDFQNFQSTLSHNAFYSKTSLFAHFSLGWFMTENNQSVWKSNIITLNSN